MEIIFHNIQEFEWDESKNQKNIQKHGLPFRLAKKIFNEKLAYFPDKRKHYKEQRYIGTGILNGRVVIVIFTLRLNKIRIISLRKANARETKKHQIYQASRN